MLNTQLHRTLLAILVLLVMSAFAATPCEPAFTNNNNKNITISSADYAFEKNPLLNTISARYVENYLAENTANLELIKEKSKSTFAMMDGVFKKYKLPLQLKYLAVIESELKPTAVSKVGAVGTWQLMPETAKILGLKISATEDERRNTPKSTKAAALYLRDLHTEFKDWLLVLAAYNCGPGPIYAAMKRSGSKNFWLLQKYLPKESRTHVHKFIATHQFFEGNDQAESLDNWKYLALQ